MGLFGNGGFMGLGMGGSPLFSSAATPGTMTGGADFATGLTSDQLLGAMNSPQAGQVQGLYDTYGATEFGNAASGLGGADQARVGNFMTNSPGQFNGTGSNVAMMQGGSPAEQGLFSKGGDIATSEGFNNAARTGMLGYFGVSNVRNANEGMDIMQEQQDVYKRQADEDYKNDQATQKLNF